MVIGNSLCKVETTTQGYDGQYDGRGEIAQDRGGYANQADPWRNHDQAYNNNNEARRQSGYGNRPGALRRVSSLDRGAFDDRRHYSRPRRDRPYYSSDSDSSSSDSSRGRRHRRSRSRRSSSRRERSLSSEDEIPSTDDEKKKRKLMGRQAISTSLATIATIQAGTKIHSSIQASKKRREKVRKGDMTEEQARVEKNKARVLDATALAIAGFGIKSAVQSWKGVKDEHNTYKEHKHARDRRKEKRRQKSLPEGPKSKSRSRQEQSRD
ncbi:MAG: hypothetical protein Q9227_004579 [Pyrenula ochraceoflavens]